MSTCVALHTEQLCTRYKCAQHVELAEAPSGLLSSGSVAIATRQLWESEADKSGQVRMGLDMAA